jgi:hypothetical protein
MIRQFIFGREYSVFDITGLYFIWSSNLVWWQAFLVIMGWLALSRFLCWLLDVEY